ncbi:MAG: two component transcriptional regulator, LuxR family [Verrucomicrobiaceae bacterium]|nr:two component transcriptional regulator, LuxR family [Verrucomicrobiaceae bacterium]
MMKKILVIEDHALMRRNLLTILTMEGYAGVAADNGRAGVELALNERPDLILCDVMMPGMDGHDVLHSLRAHPSTAGIPFIFLTAKGEKGDVRRGMNLGADDYLIKPVSRDDLVAALAARFTRRQQQRPDFNRLFASHMPLLGLGISEREAEVLLWVAQGKSNDDIAALLVLSVQTVKKHVGAILQALGVENRSSAAVRALELLHEL